MKLYCICFLYIYRKLFQIWPLLHNYVIYTSEVTKLGGTTWYLAGLRAACGSSPALSRFFCTFI